MAIFQDQPINLETVRGVSPERFVQRAERQQQAIVGDFLRMQQGIQAGIQEFEQKREEKQNMQASLQLLKEFGAVEGLSDESIKAGIKNAGGATNFLKTITDMETVAQQSRLRGAQLEALEAEAEARKQPVTPFEPRTRKINGTTYVEVQPDEFEPLEKPTPTTPAGKSVIGKPTTMEEVNRFRDEGYKPNVAFDAEGEMIITGFGTFAPPDTGPTPPTPAQEELEVGIAKTLTPWATGGKLQAEANLQKYDEIATQLLSGEVSTRTLADLTPSALGIDDSVRAIFNPSGQNALDNVRQVVFQGLKDTLGFQFTAREAEQLVNASYNPALPEEMNIKRLQDARNVLADVIAAKDDLYEHFATGGRIADYKGVQPADVLRSGIKATQDKYDADPDKGGFQAPSGITIRVKSKRPTK